MINSAREKDFQAKQESDTNDSKLSKTTSSSRQWAGFKNPRIVRVPRSFGGKDRHSKVTTIRGLRDRRIRLSVPTAIQLYDLQDRLGLSQPSKVVDWLIDATKHEIDKLPPLQMPPGNFGQFHQPVADPQESNGPQSSLPPFFNYVKDGGIKINDHVAGNDQEMRGKCKDIERENVVENKWITRHEQDNQGGNGGYMAAQNFFPVANQSFPGLLNNPIPYNPYYHWEPPNLSLSQFGTQNFPSQTDPQNNHSVLLPSSLALPSASQLFFCPPATTPSIFPPYMAAASAETDPRQQLNNHFQLLSSNSHHMLPNSLMPPLHLISQLNVHPKLHSQNNEDSQPNKGNGGS